MPFFSFTDISGETFVLRLVDPAQAAHARGLLDGSVATDFHVGGIITKAPAEYNIGWSYQIAPEDVFFFELSAEVGDSTMRYIEDHLGEVGGALLPGSRWTGWSSEMVAELDFHLGGAATDLLLGTGSADLVLGRRGDDLLVGRGGDDHLSGGAGTDLLFGGDGGDKLGGGRGDDLLVGGDGDDVLIGEGGDDRMRGGFGNDVFQLDDAALGGREIILDFAAGPGTGDRIRIDRSWLGGLEDLDGDGRVGRTDLAAAFEERGDALVLRHDADTVLILRFAAGETLNAGDFLITG